MSLQTGPITREALTQVFRSLSQKRRFGTLEIHSTIGNVQLGVANGKIVSVIEQDSPWWKPGLDRLVRGGFLPAESAKEIVERDPNPAELTSFLQPNYGISEERWMQAQRAAQMDLLYQLRSVDNGHFSFRQEMPGGAELQVLSVAPGQLLLDFVELDTDLSSFEQVFDRLDSEATFISKAREDAPGSLPPSAKAVWEELSPSACLREVCARTLLNEYELKESLNMLFVRNMIRVEHEMSSRSENNRRSAGAAEVSRENFGTASDSENSSEESLRNLVDQAASLLSGFDDVVTSAADDADAAFGEMETSSNGTHPRTVPRHSISSPNSNAPRTFFGRMWQMMKRARVKKQTLLDDESLQVITILLSTIFLWAVAFYCPWMIDRWFTALANFSSAVSGAMIQ